MSLGWLASSTLILPIKPIRLKVHTGLNSTSRLHRVKSEGKISVAYHEASDLSAPLVCSGSPVFYTHTNCPYAHRVWLTLLEKEISHELVHVDLSSKPSWFLKINPRGLVPALCYNSKRTVESLQICRFIEESMEGPKLMPEDQGLRKEAYDFLNTCDEFVNPGLSLIGGSERQWAITTKLNNNQIEAFENKVQELSSKVEQHKGPFFFGLAPTLVDFALFPFYDRFRLVLRSLFSYELNSQSLSKWLDAMRGRASCVLSSPDDALLLNAYRRHERLDFFDYTTYTVNQLHPRLVVT
eukprot:g8320.t1